MKKCIVFLAAMVAFAGTACASDVIEFPASMGKVSFPHKAHIEALKDCTKCHESKAGGKIPGFGKELAHSKGCKGCHADMGKGPKVCKECHKK